MSDSTYRQDLEETSDAEEGEVEPLNFWEAKQRDLVTSVVDYNLATLADLITNKDIDLAPKYQRRFRWDEVRQSRLIESFLMNVPVPPVFLNEDTYGQYSIIDGKQRLTAIHNFFRGRLTLQGLTVFADLNEKNFDNLPLRFQTILRTRVILRCIIILRQSDPDVKFEVFRRLNTGGVKLNAQEIRNSVYPGPLNDLILDLSENRKLHKLLGVKVKEKSKIYQEMRDAEFVLRFFTFRENWEEFTGGMRRHMDLYMINNQKPGENVIEVLRSDFLSTLDVVEACFGDNAFQRWIPEKKQWRPQVLASLYDAQMFACRGLDVSLARARRDRIVSQFQSLFSNTDFRRSIDAATNTPSFFKHRISIIERMLSQIFKA